MRTEHEIELDGLLIEYTQTIHSGEEDVGIPSGVYIEIDKVTGFVESPLLSIQHVEVDITDYNEERIKELIKNQI